MHPIYRKAMLESEILKLLSEALSQMKDPRIQEGLITLTRVELSKDKRYADVYVSCLGSDKEKVIEILNHAKGYFRTYVAKNLKLFVAPEIRFWEDKGIESSVRVHKLLVDMGYDPLKEEEKEEKQE